MRHSWEREYSQHNHHIERRRTDCHGFLPLHVITVISKTGRFLCSIKLNAGVALTRKNCVFYAKKKSRLCKSENAVRLLYAKNSDLTHQNAFSLFVFCTHQRRFVEHLPWVRALAVGLYILDFPPLPPPPFPSR